MNIFWLFISLVWGEEVFFLFWVCVFWVLWLPFTRLGCFGGAWTRTECARYFVVSLDAVGLLWRRLDAHGVRSLLCSLLGRSGVPWTRLDAHGVRSLLCRSLDAVGFLGRAWTRTECALYFGVRSLPTGRRRLSGPVGPWLPLCLPWRPAGAGAWRPLCRLP